MVLGLNLSRPRFHGTAHKAHTLIEYLDLLQDQRWKNRGDTAVNTLQQVPGQPARYGGQAVCRFRNITAGE